MSFTYLKLDFILQLKKEGPKKIKQNKTSIDFIFLCPY